MGSQKLTSKSLNQVITGLRKEVRKAILFTMRRMHQKMKMYRQSADYCARKGRQADGLVAKIHAVRDLHKTVKLDEVIKFALVNVKNFDELCRDETSASIERMALFRVVTAPSLMKAIDDVRRAYPKWHQEVPFLLQRFGQQAQQKRQERAEQEAATQKDESKATKAAANKNVKAEPAVQRKLVAKVEAFDEEDSDEQSSEDAKPLKKSATNTKKSNLLSRNQKSEPAEEDEEKSEDGEVAESGDDSEPNESDDGESVDNESEEDEDVEESDGEEGEEEEGDEEEEENEKPSIILKLPTSNAAAKQPKVSPTRVAPVVKKPAGDDEEDESEDDFFANSQSTKAKASVSAKPKLNNNNNPKRFERPQGRHPNDRRDLFGDRRPAGNRRDGNHQVGNWQAGNWPVGNKSYDNRPPGNRPYGNRPAGNDSDGYRQAGNRSALTRNGGGDSNGLHPSWEAAKRQKEQIQAALSGKSTAKRIKFND